jgi:hypothetical protein
MKKYFLVFFVILVAVFCCVSCNPNKPTNKPNNFTDRGNNIYIVLPIDPLENDMVPAVSLWKIGDNYVFTSASVKKIDNLSKKAVYLGCFLMKYESKRKIFLLRRTVE